MLHSAGNFCLLTQGCLSLVKSTSLYPYELYSDLNPNILSHFFLLEFKIFQGGGGWQKSKLLMTFLCLKLDTLQKEGRGWPKYNFLMSFFPIKLRNFSTQRGGGVGVWGWLKSKLFLWNYCSLEIRPTKTVPLRCPKTGRGSGQDHLDSV